jgi:hypothetical protein
MMLRRVSSMLLQAGGPMVSAGAVELPDGRAGFRKAVTVRDPDGHAIQIVER